MIRILLTICTLSLLWACHNGQPTGQKTSQACDSTYTPRYAKGFSIDYFKGYKLIKINDPFDTIKAKQVVCVQMDSTVDISNIKADSYLQMSNHRWVSLSSTHISPATLLNLKRNIVAVAEPQYISDSTILNGIKAGTIRNAGMAMAPDLEVILSVHPSFVMVSPFPDISYHQIVAAGIAVIPNASYMENSPLARAEWLIFTGALFNKEKDAIHQYNDIVNRYNSLKQLTLNIVNKPRLFSGSVYQGVWNTSKGGNYMSQYYKDAGADYIYKDKPGTGTLSLDYEQIYHDAAQIENWLFIVNYQGALTYDAIQQLDSRYADFKAFKNKGIIYTNSAYSLFFEQAEQRPDVVLADLIYALHPELLPNYQPVYFQRLK
jgi:iron complex transport system substrate-binding protein